MGRKSSYATLATSLLLLLVWSGFLVQIQARTFQREADMTAGAVIDPGGNQHGSIFDPSAPTWSYWVLPAGKKLNKPANWVPIPFAKSLQFQTLLTGQGEDRYFKLHDFTIQPKEMIAYWNWKDGLVKSPYEVGSLLIVFTAPETGDYEIQGELFWRHWPGPGIRDGAARLIKLSGKKETLITEAKLESPVKTDDYEPIPFDSEFAGNTISLKKGERVVLQLQTSRSRYRGLYFQDRGYGFALPSNSPEEEIELAPATVILARQLESVLDPKVPALKGMRQALQENRFQTALDRFRDAFLQFCAGVTPPHTPSQWLYSPTTAAHVRQGKIKTLVYGEANTIQEKIGAPGQVAWSKVPVSGYHTLLRDLPSMHWANALADSTANGGPANDARLWFAYWADLAQRWPDQFKDLIRDKEKMALVPKESIRWARAAPLYFGWRLENFFSWLPHVAVNLPADKRSEISAQDLAATLVWMAAEEIPLSEKILANPRGVPNQRRLLAVGLMRAGATMQWFRGIESAVQVSRTFVKDMAAVEMLPDGGSMEQSLNYNKALPKEVVSFLNANANLPKAWQFTQKERDLLERSATYRFAFLEAVLRPDGTPPTIGKNNPYVPFDPWPKNLKDFPISQALHNAFDGNTNGLGFTSVYFPWSGYAALRDGWGKTSAYSFFQNSRPGIGHHRESALRLDVAAYGEELLVNSGAEQYSNQGNFNAYFQATYSQNSISVDGYSQLTQSRKTPVRYQGPIRARWHSSDEIDYIEGVYDGPYGGWNFRTDGQATERDQVREKKVHVSDVKHTRRVLYLKQPAIWIVVDEVESKQGREFTQTWNLAPEFSPSGIKTDPQTGTIEAKKAKGASVGLWQLAQPALPLKYQIHHGVHEPNAIFGWVSKDRAPKAYDFAAAPDIHVDWKSQGKQLLVTVIAPSPTPSPRLQPWKMELDEEQEPTPQDEALAKAWLALESSTGEILSIQRQGKKQQDILISWQAPEANGWEIRLQGTKVDLTKLDAAGEKIEAIQPAFPKGFHWEKRDDQWAPVYGRVNRISPR